MPYQCLGQNGNMAVSFRSKYRVIPGRTGRSGKNTGYRLEIENWPVKCIVVNQRKKEKKYPNPYCHFHFSGSDATSTTSYSSFFVQSCSTNVSLNFLCFYFSSKRRLVKCGGVPWHYPRQLGQFKFQIDFYIFFNIKRTQVSKAFECSNLYYFC